MSNALGIDNKNNTKLRSLKNKHKGETIFIIGNGPSLTPEILSKIKGKTCLASNKIYLMFGITDWRPNYYTVEDDLVLWGALPDSCATEGCAIGDMGDRPLWWRLQ